MKENDLPMLGRESILENLHHWGSLTPQEGPVICILNGEPGIGKSKILQALQARLQNTQQGDFISLSLTSVEQFIPLQGLTILLRQIQTVREKRTICHGDSLRLFEKLLAASSGRPIFSPLQKEQADFIQMVEDFLKQHAREHPLYIFWENLHFLDQESQEVLRKLFSRSLSFPLCLMGSYQSHEEKSETFLFGERERPLWVPPLNKQSIVPMFEAVLGAVTIPNYCVDVILRHTKGNPRAICQLLAEIQHREQTVSRRYPEELFHPEWISSLIFDLQPKSQLCWEEIGLEHRRVLQWLSVTGPLRREQIEELMGMKEVDFPYIVGFLVDENYVIQTTGEQYTLSSEQMQPEIYQSLSPPERQKMYGDFANLLRKNPSSPAARIADCYQRAGQYAKSLPFSQQAATEFVQQGEFLQAFCYQRQTQKLLEDSNKDLSSLLLEIGWTCISLGHYQVALGFLQQIPQHSDTSLRKQKFLCYHFLNMDSQAEKEVQALQSATTVEEDAELALFLASNKLRFLQLKKAGTYLEAAKEAFSLSLFHEHLANKLLGMQEFYQGNWSQAATKLATANEGWAEIGNHQQQAEALYWQAKTQVMLEGIGTFWQPAQQALALAEQAGDWRVCCSLHYHLLIYSLEQHEISNAFEHWQQLKNIFSRKSEVVEQGYLFLGQARLHWQEKSANYHGLVKAIKGALDLGQEYQHPHLCAEPYFLLAKISYKRKKYKSAHRYLRYSQESYQSQGWTWMAKRLAPLKAEILAAEDKADKALELLQRAQQAAEKQQDHFHLADTYFAQAVILGKQRQIAKAAKFFSKAQQLYEQIGKLAAAKKAQKNLAKCQQVNLGKGETSND